MYNFITARLGIACFNFLSSIAPTLTGIYLLMRRTHNEWDAKISNITYLESSTHLEITQANCAPYILKTGYAPEEFKAAIHQGATGHETLFNSLKLVRKKYILNKLIETVTHLLELWLPEPLRVDQKRGEPQVGFIAYLAPGSEIRFETKFSSDELFSKLINNNPEISEKAEEELKASYETEKSNHFFLKELCNDIISHFKNFDHHPIHSGEFCHSANKNEKKIDLLWAPSHFASFGGKLKIKLTLEKDISELRECTVEEREKIVKQLGEAWESAYKQNTQGKNQVIEVAAQPDQPIGNKQTDTASSNSELLLFLKKLLKDFTPLQLRAEREWGAKLDIIKLDNVYNPTIYLRITHTNFEPYMYKYDTKYTVKEFAAALDKGEAEHDAIFKSLKAALEIHMLKEGITELLKKLETFDDELANAANPDKKRKCFSDESSSNLSSNPSASFAEDPARTKKTEEVEPVAKRTRSTTTRLSTPKK